MALAQYQTNPEVVFYGGAREERYAYNGDDTATFKAGELIRINTSGEVVPALLVSTVVGAIHGMVLETVDTATTDTIPVLMFAPDTQLRIQLNTGTPADVGKGTLLTLARSSNKWACTATTTAGIAEVVDYSATGMPWTDVTGTYQYGDDVTYGFIVVKFASAILEAHSA